MFDTGADLSYIKTNIVSNHFQESTQEKLSSANSFKMHIQEKIEVNILNNGFSLKISFLLGFDTRSAEDLRDYSLNKGM